MLKNYIKIAFRNIKRYKAFSLINISGLAIGMACCLLITLWIIDELSYDKFYDDVDQIYQTLGNGKFQSSPLPLAPALKATFPEIIYTSRYEEFGEPLFRRGENAFYENGIVVVDEDFFRIFSFPLLKGDADIVLKDINSIVISEAIAEKYFPGENPIGNVLTMNDERNLIVTGVMQNIPHNSTIQFDIAIPYQIRISEAIADGVDPNSWGWWSPKTFLKLHKDVDINSFNQKITTYFQSQFEEEEDDILTVFRFAERRFLFWDTEKYITIFSVIALFILLIACINFINLSTARSANRASEIGIRKVAGAFRTNLIFQFLGESFIIAFIAILIAILLVELLLPVFNLVTGKQLTAEMLKQTPIIILLMGLLLFSGIAAGSYPALILSSFRPVQVLKGHLKIGSASAAFRKILVVVQFSISIILIASATIIFKQLNYMKTKDIGYAKEQLITISLKGESRKSYDILKNRLHADTRILDVTGMADDLPDFWWTSGSVEWEGKDMTNEIQVGFNLVDYDIIKTLGIELIEGRDFSKEFMADVESAFLVNEELVKIMELESVVGRSFKEFGKTGQIVGVFKNVHFQPLMNKINPFFFQLFPEQINHLVIRIPTENLQATLKFVKMTWEKIIPKYPFRYRFVDEDFDRAYTNIEKMGRLANIFTFIAIFIACLGLLGLASFTAEQRSKEIGVRKVLGASVTGIVLLLTREFTKWVLIANIIAWPVSYYFMNKWLQEFAYRINISPWIFFIAGALALFIALSTVIWQATRAAVTNPIESLRYE